MADFSPSERIVEQKTAEQKILKKRRELLTNGIEKSFIKTRQLKFFVDGQEQTEQ